MTTPPPEAALTSIATPLVLQIDEETTGRAVAMAIHGEEMSYLVAVCNRAGPPIWISDREIYRAHMSASAK